MRKVSEIILLAVLLTVIVGGILFSLRGYRKHPRPHVKGVIELGRQADTSQALVTGYNYFLLQKFAEDNGKSIDIHLVRKGDPSYVDSLKAGVIDILVMSFESMETSVDSVLYSAHFDSVSVWMTARNDGKWLKEINSWIDEWHRGADYPVIRDRFLVDYYPFKKGDRDHISPYDSLFRKQADSLGMDWRFLCAVAYHESFFHIEAHSRRGAVGLMQVMPYTGRAMGIDNAVDPVQNISAGSRYLKRMYRKFRHRAADNDERLRFALAAYNAGDSRIEDCLRYAESRGIETDMWENIVPAILEMSDRAAVTSSGVVRLGTFNGSETIRYVDKVMNIYQRFCRICPEK